MKRDMVRQELIIELKENASYSDQRLADRIGVARETVRMVRNDFEYDLFTYLGKNFVNFRIQELMKIVERLKKRYDELESLKSRKTQKVVKTGHYDRVMMRKFTYTDIKFTPPTTNELIQINKQQSNVERQITKILGTDILKFVTLPPQRLEEQYPFAV